MNRTKIETVIAAAVDSAAEVRPPDCKWLIDFLIGRFEDALAKDARFPKLSSTAFDLFVADLRREAGRQAAKWVVESINEFTRFIIDKINDALAADMDDLEALRRDQLNAELESADGESL